MSKGKMVSVTRNLVVLKVTVFTDESINSSR